jgi:dTDP-glucose 4,6-dehydratase
MKVLVTGGAGFLGSNFVRFLRSNRPDWRISILDALTYAGNLENIRDFENDVSFVQGDIRNSKAVRRAVAGQDSVVHFAAETHNDNSISGPRVFVSSNVIGTFEILEACKLFDVRLHHVSTDEVFGDTDLDSKEKFGLDSSYNPSSPYSASKAASDLLVRAWVRTYGLKATISNCTNVYGPYQHKEKLIPSTILNLLNEEPPTIYGAGLNVRDWIHVDDHSSAILEILEKGMLGQTYLVSADQPRTNLEIVTRIMELMESGQKIRFVPDRPGHDRRYALDSAHLRTSLGWRPNRGPIEIELREVVDFYRGKLSSSPTS